MGQKSRSGLAALDRPRGRSRLHDRLAAATGPFRAHLLSCIVGIHVAGPSVRALNNWFGKRSEDIVSHVASTIERDLEGLGHGIAPGPYAVGERRITADCAIAPALFFMRSALAGFGLDKLA